MSSWKHNRKSDSSTYILVKRPSVLIGCKTWVSAILFQLLNLMFLIFRFLMSPSGDVGNVRGEALGQVMGLQVRVWLAIEVVRARRPHLNTEGLEDGWGRKEQMRETNKSECLEIGEPCKSNHGNQGKRRF